MNKTTLFLLLTGILFVGLQFVSCAEDSDSEKEKEDKEGIKEGENGTDSEEEDSETEDSEEEDSEEEDSEEEDSEEDTESDVCGEEFAQCCESGDECAEGLSSSIVFMEGTCLCLTPCTFNECTIGSEQGVCALVFGPNINLCVNDVDFRSDPSDCTPDETCTTLSGSTDGICITMLNTDDFASYVNRCVSTCDNPPTECKESLYCSPEMDFANSELSIDYGDGHCIENPL